MPPSRLSPIQERALAALAALAGDWTLTGGAALAGFLTGHRSTRDLDLFWRERRELGPVREEALRRLLDAGFAVEVLQSAPAFVRLIARAGEESLVIDLVADPVPAIEPPIVVGHAGVELRLDSPHEILVNKVCAILQRSELRDLLDIQALLRAGGDLERALRDAPRKDAGFAALTWLWLVRELPVESLAHGAGMSAQEVRAIAEFRDELVARVARIAAPGG